MKYNDEALTISVSQFLINDHDLYTKLIALAKCHLQSGDLLKKTRHTILSEMTYDIEHQVVRVLANGQLKDRLDPNNKFSIVIERAVAIGLAVVDFRDIADTYLHIAADELKHQKVDTTK